MELIKQKKLYRQKEQLKKDILKKRTVLEKELQSEIQKELATELASRSRQKCSTLEEAPACAENAKRTPNPEKTNISTPATSNLETIPKKGNVSTIAKRKQQKTKPTGSAKKKKKLYCICQTPYDDSK